MEHFRAIFQIFHWPFGGLDEVMTEKKGWSVRRVDVYRGRRLVEVLVEGASTEQDARAVAWCREPYHNLEVISPNGSVTPFFPSVNHSGPEAA